MLPEEYDGVSKVPRPTDPRVRIKEIQPEIGVVHRFNGSYNDEIGRRVATNLAALLMSDRVPGVTAGYAADNFQFWAYNSPFAIPYFRRASLPPPTLSPLPVRGLLFWEG